MNVMAKVGRIRRWSTKAPRLDSHIRTPGSVRDVARAVTLLSTHRIRNAMAGAVLLALLTAGLFPSPVGATNDWP